MMIALLDLLACTAGNPISCALDSLANHFPFDIFSGFISEPFECPQMDFFGQQFEVCFLYEAIAFIKYPIALSLIIKFIIAM